MDRPEDQIDEETRAWIEAKPNEYQAPEVPDDVRARAAETIEAARARGRERQQAGSLFADVDPSADEGPAKPRATSPAVEPAEPPEPPAREETTTVTAPRMPSGSDLGIRTSAPASDPPTHPADRPPIPPGPSSADQPPERAAPGLAPGAALFDADEHQAQRHPYEPDEYGRCKTCGLLADGSESTHSPSLSDKFLVPPFSVLDTRQDYWQKRRRVWLSLGIRGETTTEEAYRPDGSRGAREDGVWLGSSTKPLSSDRIAEPQKPRKGAFNQGGDTDSRIVTTADQTDVGGRRQGLIYQHDAPASDPSFYDKKRKVEEQLGREISTEEFKRDHYKRDEQDLGASQSVQTGTSVFDPVLCEIAYRWFSGPGARIIDPFAGGVVRGLVAGALGRSYTGIELRPEQIADNREQAERLLDPASGIDWGLEPAVPRWIEHDATRIGELGLEPADLIFTCPPYADLEVYSDNPLDLSTMPYARFRDCLGEVMVQTATLLRPDRFALWVVGEARGGKQKAEYGFVADTIKAAQAAGLALYNSAILVNSVGSAALRAQLILRSRKLTRVHQHVLVFLKGDPKRAAAACGSAEVGG